METNENIDNTPVEEVTPPLSDNFWNNDKNAV